MRDDLLPLLANLSRMQEAANISTNQVSSATDLHHSKVNQSPAQGPASRDDNTWSDIAKAEDLVYWDNLFGIAEDEPMESHSLIASTSDKIPPELLPLSIPSNGNIHAKHRKLELSFWVRKADVLLRCSFDPNPRIDC